MKRILVCLTGLFLLMSSSLAALEWYQSTEEGLLISLLEGEGPRSEGWSLRVDFENNQERHRLYQDGIFKTEEIFIRSEGRLLAREKKDVEGKIISRIDYLYDSDGNPRTVLMGKGEANEGWDYLALNTAIQESQEGWQRSSGSEGKWRISKKNSAGRPLQDTLLENEEIISETLWEYSEEGLLRQEIFKEAALRRIRQYDDKERLVEESHFDKEEITLFKTYVWRDDKLLRVEEKGKGQTSVVIITWENENKVSEEKQINGLKVSETIWENATEWIETLYRDNQAIVRIYWKNNQRQREEFLQDGSVLRVNEASP